MLQKLIVLNGLARGGTNMVWNILQSHPGIVSPQYETNQILGDRTWRKTYFHPLIKKQHIPLVQKLTAHHLQKVLEKKKRMNLSDRDNRFCTENEVYSLQKLQQAVLCLKGVCSPSLWDLQYNPLWESIAEDVRYIGLVRNGYALCESWMRRGISAKQAGVLYARFVNDILEEKEKYQSYTIIKFEDVLEKPFATAEQLFQLVDEKPYTLNKLRLKVKKTLGEDGLHTERYGEVGRKYWFSKETIGDILIGNINSIQKKHLEIQDIRVFEKEAREALEYFEYK